MKSYWVKQRKQTNCVPGSEIEVITKKGRNAIKCKCSECGITKITFVGAKPPSPQKTGGALARYKGPSDVDKAAYIMSNFVTPEPRFAALGRVLAGQAFKVVKDNVDYYRAPIKSFGVGGKPPKYKPPTRGRGLDIHKAIGKLPKPKGGWTIPGHKYTGPYNDLDKQVKYDKKKKQVKS